MELSIYYFYVDAGITFQGTFRISVVCLQNDFLMKCQLFKFKTADTTILQTIISKINQDPTNSEFFKKIEMNLECECFLTKDESIELYGNYNACLLKIFNEPETKLYQWPILNKMKVVLSLKNVNIFKNELEKFYKGYDLLCSMYTKINNKEHQPTIPTVQTQVENIENITHVQETQQITPLTQILDGCVNKIISSFLINTTYSYYQYITTNECYITEQNELKVINIPNILSSDYIFDEKYFESLMLSLRNTQSENFNLSIRVLLNQLGTTTDRLHIMMISLLLFIYITRHLYDSHTNWILLNLSSVIHENELKIKIMNHHLKVFYPDLFNKIRFNDSKQKIDKFNQINEQILEISNEFNHIIPVSNDEFIKNVILKLNTYESKFPLDFKTTQPNILDLNDINKYEYIRAKKSELLNSSKLFYYNDDNINVINLIDYQFKESFITLEYQLLMKYIQNPETILLIKNEIPLEIKNMFELFKNILNDSTFSKNIINTLDYYEIICSKIPDATVFTHIVLLQFVFRIIIPYYFHTYKIKRFIDYLL